jgi:hypothetical protein
MRNPSHVADAPRPDCGRELTDAELEAVTAGKELLRPDMEGPNGWFVPLPEKLRRR